MSPTVLVVDDERYVRDSLCESLEAEGYQVLSSGGGRRALELLAAGPVDVVLTDLSMQDGGGQELLERARESFAGVRVVLMTGVGTIPDAVRAMRAGAWDFLQKPVELEHLLGVVRRAVEHHGLKTEVSLLRRGAEDRARARRLVGDSPPMSAVRQRLAQVAQSDAIVLLRGESGTGKELAAEELHRASPRGGRSLVRLRCASMPAAGFEAELFGERRGAHGEPAEDRTGRLLEAQGGTLLLDEVGALHLESQARLLHFLESGEYLAGGETRPRQADVRIVAISNEDLEAQVHKGGLRADLFWRLNVFPIVMPPLREMRADLPAIASELLERLQPPLAGARLDEAALAVLSDLAWPGNVRELRNALERALIVNGGRVPDAETLRAVLEPGLLSSSTAAPEGDLTLRRNLDALEKQLLASALERSLGRKKDAAAMLGVDPRNLGYYLRKHKM